MVNETASGATRKAAVTESPLETRTLSAQIYEYLTNRIIGGEIAYGDRLSIREIAEILGVSSMPVRDAIRRLEFEGIIEVRPRSTCIVRMPTRRDMLDAFELRVVLELHAVKRVYPSVTSEDLGQLEGYLDAMEAVMPVGDDRGRMGEFVKYDQLFHVELCRLAGNAQLLRAYRSNALHLNISFTVRAGIEPDMERLESDHRRIYELLRENSSEAVDVLQNHLLRCRSNMARGTFFASLEAE